MRPGFRVRPGRFRRGLPGRPQRDGRPGGRAAAVQAVPGCCLLCNGGTGLNGRQLVVVSLWLCSVGLCWGCECQIRGTRGSEPCYVGTPQRRQRGASVATGVRRGRPLCRLFVLEILLSSRLDVGRKAVFLVGDREALIYSRPTDTVSQCRLLVARQSAAAVLASHLGQWGDSAAIEM